MEKRRLGKTGLEVSVIGAGGFHLLEIPAGDAARILNTYLDRGGNYVETAGNYGNGVSEKKIGAAVASRRGELVLATKSAHRGRDEYLRGLDESLRNLKTDHLDIVFFHAVQSPADVDAILGEGGALEGALEARRAGKLRFIGITGHGRPHSLLYAVHRHAFDVLMTGFNYFDRYNFPEAELELIPQCRSQGTGVLAMKPLADGYLYRSVEPAFRYTLSLPVAGVVTGINTMQQLEVDLRIAESFRPMTDREREDLSRTAPELGDYVCRFCGKCAGAFDPQTVFRLEALYDRQMDDRRPPDAAHYALRERLKFWFGQKDLAREEYAHLAAPVDPARDYRVPCPYGIDVDRKLKIAHSKLSQREYIH
jgi:uncharacterized protein